MAADSKVYIAGVGISPSPPGSVASLVSAATKALLDAGLTYDNVTRGVRSKDLGHGSQAFKVFGDDSVPVNEVKAGSELDEVFSRVATQGAQCVLVITKEKAGAVALVLISEDLLWRHPYLKDSAISICASGSSSKSGVKETLHGVCQAVWTLRGWSDAEGKAEKLSSVCYRGSSKQSFELSRADAKLVPEWKEIEHRQDGKHRLGYNPATTTKDASQEDFEAVKASGQQQIKSNDKLQFRRKGGDRAALARL